MTPLYLLHASPLHGEARHPSSRSLRLKFSAPVLRFTCRAGIKLFRFEEIRAGIEVALPVSFKLRDAGRRVHVHAEENALHPDEVYLLRITPALCRADGKPFNQAAHGAPANPYTRFARDGFYQAVFATGASKKPQTLPL